MWKLKTKKIPVATGALDMIKKGTQNFICQISRKSSLQEMEKLLLTSTVQTLREMLWM